MKMCSRVQKIARKATSQRALLVLRLSGTFVGRSVNVPIDGRSGLDRILVPFLVAATGTGKGAGWHVGDNEDAEDPNDKAGGESRTSASSSLTVMAALTISWSPSCSSRSGPVGSGTCSCTKVSLPIRESPFSLHSCRISSRLLVTFHWSTYSTARLRGVVPVDTSSCVPRSASVRLACCIAERPAAAVL
jgi:hypothetical protein